MTGEVEPNGSHDVGVSGAVQVLAGHVGSDTRALSWATQRIARPMTFAQIRREPKAGLRMNG